MEIKIIKYEQIDRSIVEKRVISWIDQMEYTYGDLWSVETKEEYIYISIHLARNNFFLGVVEEEKKERRKKDIEIKKMRVFARAQSFIDVTFAKSFHHSLRGETKGLVGK